MRLTTSTHRGQAAGRQQLVHVLAPIANDAEVLRRAHGHEVVHERAELHLSKPRPTTAPSGAGEARGEALEQAPKEEPKEAPKEVTRTA